MKNKRTSLAQILTPVVIVLAAMLLASGLILIIGVDPLHAYGQMFKGAFGSVNNLINSINKAVPICFAAFAVDISTRAGIFNIGVEGQLVFGAFGAAIAGAYLQGLPPALHLTVSLLAGMLFGMLFALLPTVLYVLRGLNLLVLFILMNSIAKLLITYFIVGPFAVPGQMFAATKEVAQSAWLPYLVTKPNRLTSGIAIVFFVALILRIYIHKTTSGYRLRACGDNAEAARYAGIHVRRYQAGALLIGGALAGLAGAVEVLGTYHRLYDGFSPGYGFDGIPIAMLAGGNPFGMIAGSILFGALRVGSTTMQSKAGVSSEIVTFIQGVLVTLIAAQYIIRFGLNKLLGKRSGKEAP